MWHIYKIGSKNWLETANQLATQSSSNAGGNFPVKGYDGNDKTYFSSKSPRTSAQWWQLDFERLFAVTEIELTIGVRFLNYFKKIDIRLIPSLKESQDTKADRTKWPLCAKFETWKQLQKSDRHVANANVFRIKCNANSSSVIGRYIRVTMAKQSRIGSALVFNEINFFGQYVG